MVKEIEAILCFSIFGENSKIQNGRHFWGGENFLKIANLVNFIVIGIFINKNTYIIPTEAYVTYRSVKDTDNVSRHFFLLKVHT